jgi:hypothetical protein
MNSVDNNVIYINENVCGGGRGEVANLDKK